MVSETNSIPSGKLVRKRSALRYKTFDDMYMATGEQLGSGAFGQVQTYRDIAKGGEFAVKVIDTLTSGDSSYHRNRILKEIAIYNLCKGHPNVVQIVQYFEEGPKFFLVFEKLGKDLWEVMFINGIPTENEVKIATREIAQGLEFLHSKGIAHRDLKPQNILCDKSGGFSPLKICDFDLAADLNNSTPDKPYEPTSAVGTAQFMAPEMVDCWRNGVKAYDAKCCDMWSLGAMMYLMFCGQYPFYGDLECKCADATFLCDACKNSVFDKIECAQPTFEEDMWDDISVRASDLVESLLALYPYRRCTVEELLCDTWLNGTAESDSSNDGDVSEILDVELLDISSALIPMDEPTFVELEIKEDAPEVESIPGQCSEWSTILEDRSSPSKSDPKATRK